MSMKTWEKKVLEAEGAEGAEERVAEIEDELRFAAGLTALREREGLSQRDLAKRIGVSQPRVAAIEQSRNVTLDVLEQYVEALGGQLEVNVIKGNRKVVLIGRRKTGTTPKKPRPKTKKGPATRTASPAKPAIARRSA